MRLLVRAASVVEQYRDAENGRAAEECYSEIWPLLHPNTVHTEHGGRKKEPSTGPTTKGTVHGHPESEALDERRRPAKSDPTPLNLSMIRDATARPPNARDFNMSHVLEDAGASFDPAKSESSPRDTRYDKARELSERL